MKRILLLLFILFATAIHSWATLRGGEITYKALGNNLYRVSLVVYKQCIGSVIYPIIQCRVGTDSIASDSQLTLASLDITGLNESCPDKSYCQGGSFPGIERLEWVAYFNLDSFSSCEVKFFTEYCCRNTAVTTMLNSYFYLEAVFNQCLAPNNNSPEFTRIPEFHLCHHQDQSLTFNASNSICQDSLSYHFVSAKKQDGVNVNYVSGFSPTRWLNFFGHPVNNLPWPLGLHLDPVSGEVRFRPTKINENPVGVVEVKQYRKINGMMTYIGSIYREVMPAIIPCPNNNQPEISSHSGNSVIICAGETACVQVSAWDEDTQDSVQLSWNSDIPGATFTHNSGLVKHPTGNVCWKTDSSDICNIPYQFTISAKDNSCPLMGQTSRTFTFFVVEKPAANPVISYTACGNLQANAQADKNYTYGIYTWTIRDSIGNIYGTHKAENPILKVPSGKVFVSLKFSLGNCILNYSDSLVIPDYLDSIPKVYLPSDTAFCQGTPFSLTVSDSSLYTYKWNTGETTATITAGAGFYEVEVTGYPGCTVKKNILVKEYPAPRPQISAFKGCVGDTVWFYSNADLATIFSLNWSDGFIGHPYIATDSGMITNQVISSTSGCLFSDTLIADIAKEPDAKIQYQVKDDTVFFTSDIHSSKWTYKWFFGDGTIAFGRNQAKHYFSNKTYRIILNSADRHCISADTITMAINISVGEIQGSSLIIYPNPFLSKLNIELKTDCSQTVLVNLHDMAGKLVFEESIITPAEAELHLDLGSADLSPGVYYLSLGCGENVYRQKVVKQE